MTQGQSLSVYKQVQLSLRSILFTLIYVKSEIGPEHIWKNLGLFLVDSVLMHHWPNTSLFLQGLYEFLLHFSKGLEVANKP